jgi:hypothetical protein
MSGFVIGGRGLFVLAFLTVLQLWNLFIFALRIVGFARDGSPVLWVHDLRMRRVPLMVMPVFYFLPVAMVLTPEGMVFTSPWRSHLDGLRWSRVALVSSSAKRRSEYRKLIDVELCFEAEGSALFARYRAFLPASGGVDRIRFRISCAGCDVMREMGWLVADSAVPPGAVAAAASSHDPQRLRDS